LLRGQQPGADLPLSEDEAGTAGDSGPAAEVVAEIEGGR